MSHTYVIVGSDTEVGKTYVSCGILRAARRASLSSCGLKPIESGIEILTPDSEDGARLASAANQGQPTQALIRLDAPVAPPLAAERQGVTLDWSSLMDTVDGYLSSADVTLVEGAGGLLSPLLWNKTAMDLASRIHAPMLLVVADKLGAVHQTRVSVMAARSKGIAVAAVVLNGGVVEDETTGHNQAALKKCPEWQAADAPVIVDVPFNASETAFDALLRTLVS